MATTDAVDPATEAAVREDGDEPYGLRDLSSLLETLSERLHERNVQERWYPGAAAWIDANALPYYRMPTAGNVEELLEVALARPAGVRVNFDDWLASFDRRREEERELRRRLARARHEDRAVATHQRIALAGGMACSTASVGLLLTVLAVLPHSVRPNAFIALALAIGGMVLMAAVGVAIRERRWNAVT